MKIVQLLYSLSSGGAEKFATDLSNSLAARGHDVTVLILLDDSDPALRFNEQFLRPNVKVESLGFTPGLTLGKIRKASRRIRELVPDVVHCHLNMIPYILPLALKRSGIRFVHTLHSLAQYTLGRGQRPVNRWLYRTGRVTPVCISPMCRKSYEDLYHLSNAAEIINGRSADTPTPKAAEVAAEVRSYCSKNSTPVFVHVSRHNPLKNQRLLVDTFNLLDSQGVDFTLLVIGSNFDSPEGMELRNSACDRIHFLGEKPNVVDYLACADAFCLTSRYEGLPISLLEAMSIGLTPICTAVGGIPDVLSDGLTGYLCTGDTPEEYAATVRRFLNHPLDKEAIKNCYASKYSIESCAKSYENVYRR